MIAQLDVSRNAVSELDESLDDPPLQLGGTGEPYVFQDAKFDRDIPLDGQFVVRDGGGDPIEFGEHGFLIGWLNHGAVLRRNESGDGCQRRRKADLEAIVN